MSPLAPLRAACSLLAAAFLAASLGGGCVASPESAGEEDAANLDSAILASDAIARAEEWVGAKLHYCQAPNHAHDYDAACSSTCNRHDDPNWNPYRSDCSGLVSWAWGLPAPGRVTGQFAPFKSDISHSIAASSLQPGDAVNNSDHVMLFKHWTVPNQQATFIEEPGCSSSTPYAHEFTSNVSINGSSIHVSWNGMTFTAIRFDGISSAPPAPPGPPTAAPKEPTGCGIIHEGEGLAEGHAFPSCDGRFSLAMQTDGNLVLYHNGAGALWTTHSNGSDGFSAVVQSDGNFVLYGKHSNALWASKTSGHSGAHLAVQDDGNLVVYAGGKALWASNTVVAADPPPPPPPPAVSGCTNFAPGQALTPGQQFSSCDGKYTLAMQTDGNLVLYHNGVGALWSTKTNGKGGHTAVMQGDGNFVLYDAASHPLWASNTSGHGGAHLAVQDDGNLVVYAGASPLWNTHTNGK